MVPLPRPRRKLRKTPVGSRHQSYMSSDAGEWTLAGIRFQPGDSPEVCQTLVGLTIFLISQVAESYVSACRERIAYASRRQIFDVRSIVARIGSSTWMSVLSAIVTSMTEIAYMVREDWAHNGTMADTSANIRQWLGDPPFHFFAPDLRKHHAENDADQEFVAYVTPDPETSRVFDLSELSDRRLGDEAVPASTVIHPFTNRECERLHQIVEAGVVGRLFVIVWAPTDRVRIMLDALGAEDLHTGERTSPSDALQRLAAQLMVDEQYNGLSSGRGKDAVIQLLRVFRDDGYPLDERRWLHALYAEGATFASGEAVSKFIREMNAGTRHRVSQRFTPDIIDLLRAELETS